MTLASDTLTRVRNARVASEAAKPSFKAPANEAKGGYGSMEYTVLAADVTAGFVDIVFQDFSKVILSGLVIRDSAGVLKIGDQVITVTGNTVRVASGATKALVAGDVLSVTVRGE